MTDPIPGYDAWIFRTPADDACPECSNHRSVDCPNCGGDGDVAEGVDCPECEGSGSISCPMCADNEPDGDYLYELARDRRAGQ